VSTGWPSSSSSSSCTVLSPWPTECSCWHEAGSAFAGRPGQWGRQRSSMPTRGQTASTGPLGGHRPGVGRVGEKRIRCGVASLAVVVLAAACGTRVADGRVRAAAGIAGVEVLAPAPAPAGAPSGATAPAAPAGTGAPATATASASQAASRAAAGAGSPRPTAASPTAAAGPATGSPVVVGAIGTLSGPVGTIVGDIVKGVQIWAQYINAHGGVNGHVVRLVVGDDGGDPARFNSLAQQMVEQGHAIAFVFTSLGLAPGGNNTYLDRSE